MENINFSRARKSLKPYVGDVEAAAVPCGLGRAIGNKVHDKIAVHAFITPPLLKKWFFNNNNIVF
jgi:hypothetical protein